MGQYKLNTFKTKHFGKMIHGGLEQQNGSLRMEYR